MSQVSQERRHWSNQYVMKITLGWAKRLSNYKSQLGYGLVWLEISYFGDEWLLNCGIGVQWRTPFFQTPLSVWFMVGRAGIEPATTWLKVRCFNPLKDCYCSVNANAVSQTSGSLQPVLELQQEFLLFIWDSQRCHVGDVTAVELLGRSGRRMTKPFWCNLKFILGAYKVPQGALCKPPLFR